MPAIWSPLPPSRSGISHYVQTLYRDAPEFGECIYVAEREDQRGDADVVAPDDPAASQRECFLQVGNNAFHGYIFERAQQGGAIVELHDISLHHVLTEMTLARGDAAAYVAALEESEGDWGRRFALQRLNGFYSNRLDFHARACTAICNRAEAVIVHSEWARSQLRLRDVSTPIHVVPHFALDIAHSAGAARDRAGARAQLGLDPDHFIVLAAGHVTPAKRLDWTLDAFERLAAARPEAHLVVAGACSSERLAQRFEESPFADRISLTGYVDDADFDDHVLAADMLSLMRFPSAGESSGVASRALGFGRLTVVPDYMAFSDFAPEVCEKIDLTRDPVEQLAGVMQFYCDNRAALAAKEQAALAHAAEALSLEALRPRVRSIMATHWGAAA